MSVSKQDKLLFPWRKVTHGLYVSGLDQKVEQDFFELLQELNRHLTIVLVTHDLGFVAGFVRTVICVHGHVDIHPTSSLDGRAISEIYGGEVRMVRHDHRMDH